VLTRRDWLKLVGWVSVTWETALLRAVAGPPTAGSDAIQAVARAREPLQALTAVEADLLDAVVARLIPTDANGPGATEAQAVRYIDRALAGALAGSREAYRLGLAALDRYSQSSRGAPFTTLSPVDQDSVLIDVETGAATGSGAGFAGSSTTFFTLIRTHTLQGTFGDPYYGGNADFVGWDLLGYPGVRTVVSAADQRLGVTLTPSRKSAYDHEMFTKATARAQTTEGQHRG
jgi:gluconate 2-dehydrogenase gamma chain